MIRVIRKVVRSGEHHSLHASAWTIGRLFEGGGGAAPRPLPGSALWESSAGRDEAIGWCEMGMRLREGDMRYETDRTGYVLYCTRSGSLSSQSWIEQPRARKLIRLNKQRTGIVNFLAVTQIIRLNDRKLLSKKI